LLATWQIASTRYRPWLYRVTIIASTAAATPIAYRLSPIVHERWLVATSKRQGQCAVVPRGATGPNFEIRVRI
jgi:hypothetical protein